MLANTVELETLIYLNHLKSFIATAKKMNTCQSNITKRIQKMEADLGKKLIIGKGSGMRLTSDGLIVYKYAPKILKLHDRMLYELRHPTKNSSNLAIGSSETITMLLLSNIINKFNEHYPNIHIDIQVDTSNNLRKKILNNEIDIAFLIGQTAGLNCYETPLISYKMGWFINKDLVTYEKFSDMLQHYPLITFSKDTPPFINLEQVLRHKKLKNYRIYHCASLYALIDLTINKTGIGIFPKIISQKAKWHNKLIEIKGPTLEPLNYYVSYKSTLQSTITQKLLDISINIANDCT